MESRTTKPRSILTLVAITLVALAASAYAQSLREQLNQMVVQLQKAPSDRVLREKIIRVASEISPAPVIPEEANRAFVKGGVFQRESKDPSGYQLAISAYQDALRVAPWWGDAYFNLGVVLESAGRFDEAISSIKLYMASVPRESPEGREAQNRIYAIEAKSEMAAPERERMRFIASIEGKYVCTEVGYTSKSTRWEIEVFDGHFYAAAVSIKNGFRGGWSGFSGAHLVQGPVSQWRAGGMDTNITIQDDRLEIKTNGSAAAGSWSCGRQ